MAWHSVFFFLASWLPQPEGAVFCTFSLCLCAWRLLIKMSLKGQAVFWNFLVLTLTLEFSSSSHSHERKHLSQRWHSDSGACSQAVGKVPWLLFFLSFFVLLGDQQGGASPRPCGKWIVWNIKLGIFSYVPERSWTVSLLSFVFSLFFPFLCCPAPPFPDSVSLNQPASQKFVSDLLLCAPLRCEFHKVRGPIFHFSGNPAARFLASIDSWRSVNVHLLGGWGLLSWSVNQRSKCHLYKAVGRIV